MVEYHAASCEGKRDGEVDMDGGGGRRRVGPEILEVNLPPEKPGGKGASGSSGSAGAKTRPSSSEPAAKRAGPPSSSSVRRTPSSSSSSGRVECPICNERYAKSAIEEHAANCGEEVYV